MTDPQAILKRRLESSTATAIAADLGVAVSQITEVAGGSRKAGPKLLKALGLKRQIKYVRQ